MSRLMRLLFAASVVGLGAFPSLGAAAAVNIAIEPHDSDAIKIATIQERGYAPASDKCPSSRPEVRSGPSLSPREKAWLPKRRQQTISHIRDFLKRNAIPGFDSDKYLGGVGPDSPALPNIGIAVSGGGYRAMLTGAGAVAAFDSRSPGSTSKGNIGGLLQSATYLSGLSGGGWLVGSIYANNFTTIQAAVNSGRIWQFGRSILKGPAGMTTSEYYALIFLEQVRKKHKEGYRRTITDYWGRMLSYQLVDAKDGGSGVSFSSIAEMPDFAAGGAPLPILVADSRAPGQKRTTLDDAMFEINPWELGSSDSVLNGFVPLKYVGSNFDNGKIPSQEPCVTGFDNVGYVMGTSSSLFNQIVLRLRDNPAQYVPPDVPKSTVKMVVSVLRGLSFANYDIADWGPNPFRGWNRAANKAARADSLTLVDGGVDEQNVPFLPHLQPSRKVDVVFAVDSTADRNSWPDGSSPMTTYQRSLRPVSGGTGSFPVIPGRNTFVNLGLNTRPTFFGCNSANTSTPAPLVVYLPNYPYLFRSNISTFSLTVSNTMRDALIANGWAVATQLNGARDQDWPVCVSCAMIQRSLERTKTALPSKCKECFSRYCWNGTIDEREPAKGYYPPLYGKEFVG
ncbi:uncharacterized protein UV8b_07694 [Ustilaginoidea virens]|uniref:Lysophospholipase n=1 Tax=Ustilaginoidea virens TaxID=1159556 RepID=A0A8E5HY55_USTVR|nr:uncharacterized protein UV8b_07694 [Ustilaginoidea virens]QUC23453.1 hypothetical protein UV8b_07694 [Ustilaginoidea virens]